MTDASQHGREDERPTIADVAARAERFTDYSVPDPGIRSIYEPRSELQAWIDVEVALARAEGEAGIVPAAAARRIAEVGTVDAIDMDRLLADLRADAHPVSPLIAALATAAGEEAGRWVHWGATSQNITQTGNALLLRRAHGVLSGQQRRILLALADLAERTATTVMPGRTHGQHAVPITFGLKVATWIDDLLGASDRTERGLAPCLRALMGGAVGTFAAFGNVGPSIQARVAELLGLEPAAVPSRALLGPQAGYACDVAVLSAACARIAVDVETMMQTEFGEVSEPIAEGSIGSSTMPQKRNPKLCADVIELSAVVRAEAPPAVAAVIHAHEADGSATSRLDNAMRRIMIAMGDLLERLAMLVEGLELFPGQMQRNLALSGGRISAEAVMTALGRRIGHPAAHRLVYRIAMRSSEGNEDFGELLRHDPEVRAHLSAQQIAQLLTPRNHVGLAPALAMQAAQRARRGAEGPRG